MSIVNFCLSRDRVSIITDTIQFCDGVAAGLCLSKASENGKFAYAHRGPSWLGDADDRLLEKFADYDLDLVIDALVGREMPGTGLDAKHRYQLFLFGWSQRIGAMHAIQFLWKDEGLPTVRGYSPGVYIEPEASASRNLVLPATATLEQLFRIGLVQFEVPRKHSLPYCIGGVAHLTEVTALGSSRRIFGLFPDYDEMTARFGDPNAEAVSAWRAATERLAA